MAEIKLTAMCNAGGPQVPSELGAILSNRHWPDVGGVPVLRLIVGDDTLEIWPADPDRIQELGDKLIKIAAELHRREQQRKAGPHPMVPFKHPCLKD